MKPSVNFTSIRLILLCILYCLSFVQYSFAENEPLKVVVLNAKPYAFYDADSDVKGLLQEITDLIMKEANLSYKISMAPFSRIKEELSVGNKDISFLVLSKSMEQVAECVEYISYARTIIIGKKNNVFSSLQDLYNLRHPVGGLRGAKYGKVYDNNLKITKSYANTYLQNINMLFHDRVSAIVGVEEGIYKAAEELGYSKDEFGPPLLLNESINCLFFSKMNQKNHSNEIQVIKRVTKKLREEGKLDRIIKKGFSTTNKK